MDHIIILAGGKGTRMNSDRPKVLTLVKGVPIIKRLLKTVSSICKRPTIIVGHKASDVIGMLGTDFNFVLQKEQNGTGHAVLCAKDSLHQRKDVRSIVVLPGDHPLVSKKTVQKLIDTQKETGAAITLATLVVPSYEGEHKLFEHYGRIVKDEKDTVSAIVEFKDASEDVRNIKEVNLSYYCFDPAWLWQNIDTIGKENASKEYYLTDLIAIARSQQKLVISCPVAKAEEAMGINTPEQLKIVESYIK